MEPYTQAEANALAVEEFIDTHADNILRLMSAQDDVTREAYGLAAQRSWYNLDAALKLLPE